MNDAVDILWYQDSESASAAGFGGNAALPSDHVETLAVHFSRVLYCTIQCV